jgi:hypothetical protein
MAQIIKPVWKQKQEEELNELRKYLANRYRELKRRKII